MPINSNPEDKGRFLKDILRGVPSGYGLTRGEQTVRELSRISQTLNSVRNRLPASVSTSSPKTEFVTVPSTQTQDLSRVESAMGDAAASQSRTADNTDRLTEQGAESLQLQNTLVSLGIGHARQNRTAIDQRDQLIGQGEISIQDLHSLVSNSQTANALLQTLGEQGFITLLVQAGILRQGEELATRGGELVQHAVKAAKSREVAERQRERLIDNSRLAVTVLESLDSHGRDAYIQRLKIVSEVAQTRGAIELLDQDLVRSGEQTHRDLSAIHSQGGQILAEAQGHTSILNDISDTSRHSLVEARQQSRTLASIDQTVTAHLDEARQQSRTLANMDQTGAAHLDEARQQSGILTNMSQIGVLQLVEAHEQSRTLANIDQTGAAHLDEARQQSRTLGMISAVGFAQLNALENLGGIMSTAVSILGDIDYGIAELNKGVEKLNATAIEAVEQLEDISRAMGMFVIISHEIRDQLRAVNDTLNKPVTVKARDLWNIAERCRQAGDIESAVAKFIESQKEDPSYYKNYYSLALVCLELSIIDTAEDFLLQAQAYAKQSGNKAEREVLHLLGKLEFMTHRLSQALEHLYLAYEKDPNDFTVWYDIALTEMFLGDKNAALGFLKALVRVAKAKSPGYISKIKAEPIFAPIINELSI